MTQGQLFGFDVSAESGAPRSSSKGRRPSQRMRSEQCPSCGGWFMSFCRGVRCDDCRKAKRAERKAQPSPSKQMGAGDRWEDFAPGF